MRGSDNASLFGDNAALVAAAAHELKNPLTLISYISQMLGDESVALSNRERAAYIQRLQLVSKRSLRLLHQLTISYRLENNNQPELFAFALEPVNTREICESALHELTPYAHEHRQILQLEAKACPHLALANREVLYDIVVNLVDNAIQHNSPGTVVRVRPTCQQKYVRLHVHDNGVATRASEMAKLRRTIGRSPQPLSGRSGSSGLGLYIVQQFASAMGGNLGLGRAEEGATFFVDLLRSQQLSLLP